MTNYTHYSDLSVSGKVSSSKQGDLIGSAATMPEASAANLGLSILYTGATSGGYVKNTVYTCVQDGSSYSWATAISPAADTSGLVPTSRKVAGHALTGDVTISASDVGAVPTGRTVNGKALSADITLSASDVGALASNGTAVKATADASGNNIADTYATKTTVPSAYQPKLTFDDTPTASSTNPVKSGGVKSYVDNGLSGKQDTLTFDSTPTANSANPVTSGGVKAAIDSAIADAGGVEIHTSISVSSWSSDATYSDYPYRASVAITGVTASDVAEVVFAVEQAVSGDYAPVCATYSGGVYLYSKVNDAITVPTIMVFKG